MKPLDTLNVSFVYASDAPEGAVDEIVVPAEDRMRSTIRSALRKLAKLLSHGGNLALIDQAVVSGTNFLTSLAIARFCGRAELGVYLLAWTVISLVNEVLNAVVATPYYVICPTLNRDQQDRYRSSMLLHQLALSLTCAVCIGVAAVALERAPDKAAIGHVIGLLAVFIVVFVFREFVRRMFFAHLRMRIALMADAIACILQLITIAALIVTQSLSAAHAYIAIAVVSLIPGSIWLAQYFGHFRIDALIALIDFRRNWMISKWILGSGVLWAGAMYAYPWLIVWMHGAALTGVWAACYGLVALSNPVLLGFGNYLGPKVAIVHGHDGVAAMRRYIYRSSAMFVLLLSPLAVVVWIWGDALVRHLYGAIFAGQSFTLRVLVVNVLIAGAVYPFSRGFFSIQRADLDMAVNVLAVVILLTFGLALVRSYGVAGAALGLAVTNGSTAIIRAGLFGRVTRHCAGRAFAVAGESVLGVEAFDEDRPAI